MLNYNKNKGNTPKINDRVIVCHTYSDMDGLIGFVGGWVDCHQMIAIVILDRKYYEHTAVTMPVVCLNNSQHFEIEDLDPDKRSWYYDGYGVKRKKENA